jgi:hypothetical protein
VTESPYAPPAASLESPGVLADPRDMRLVRFGVDVLIGAEIAAIGIRIASQYLGPAVELATVFVAVVWAVGVFVVTTPVAERSALTIAARALALAAMLSGIVLFLWRTRVEGPGLTGGALWANYGVSMTAALTNTGAQCLILVTLRPVLTLVGDLRGLRANTVGVWLLAVGSLAQQINTWAWRLAGNEIVSTLERFQAVDKLAWYRGLSVLFVGVLVLTGFVYYLGGLVRVRRHCSRSLRESGRHNR